MFCFVFCLVVQCWFRVAIDGFRAGNLWEGGRKFVCFNFVDLLSGGESEFFVAGSQFPIMGFWLLAVFCGGL